MTCAVPAAPGTLCQAQSTVARTRGCALASFGGSLPMQHSFPPVGHVASANSGGLFSVAPASSSHAGRTPCQIQQFNLS